MMPDPLEDVIDPSLNDALEAGNSIENPSKISQLPVEKSAKGAADTAKNSVADAGDGVKNAADDAKEGAEDLASATEDAAKEPKPSDALKPRAGDIEFASVPLQHEPQENDDSQNFATGVPESGISSAEIVRQDEPSSLLPADYSNQPNQDITEPDVTALSDADPAKRLTRSHDKAKGDIKPISKQDQKYAAALAAVG